MVSVSCPTAEISGIGEFGGGADDLFLVERPQVLDRPAAARDDQEVGARFDRRETADRRRDLRRRALALDRHRPQDHPRRAAVLEPVEDVADHRAGRRGDDSDDPRQERQPALSLRREQSFRGERLAPLLEQREQRALARDLHPLDDDLVFRPARIGGELAGGDDLGAVLGKEGERAALLRQITASMQAFSSFSVK